MSEHKHSATCGCHLEAKLTGVNVDYLYASIDTTKIWCLNEGEPESGKKCIKPHSERKRGEATISDDSDPELLLYIPFTTQVKVLSFCMIAAGETAPSKVRMWVNREDIDFSNASEVPPTQSWDVNEDTEGVLDYPTQIHKFQNVSSLLIHVPSSVGGENTRIEYLGFKGEATKNKREIVNVVYEARAQPKDHKSKAEDMPHMGAAT